jgi:hypothetical protein
MNQPWIAVLHLRSKTPTNVYQLAGKVYASMSENQAKFPNQASLLATLLTENTKLNDLIAGNNGSDKKQFDLESQTDNVLDILKDLIAYVNLIAKGDKSIILLSGFDCNNEPVKHEAPGKPVIRKVKDGKTACSVKLIVEADAVSDKYKVQTTSTPLDPNSWEDALEGSRNNLELKELPYAKELYLRVKAGNTHGWSDPSDAVAFVPR